VKLLAVAVGMLLLLPAFGQRQSTKDAIQRQYKRWSQAALVNDVDTILSILREDYTLHPFTGAAIPRKDYEVSLRKRKAASKPATVYETSIADITVTGNTALVTSDETSNNISVDPITNKKMKLVHVHRYKDTWVRSQGTWRLQTTITTVETTKVVPIS